MTSLAALTCPLPGLGDQLSAPKMAAGALPEPEGGVGTRAPHACALADPLQGLRSSELSRERCRDLHCFSFSIMALKVAKALGGSAKAVLRPALLCRPWEVRWENGLQGQLQRSLGVFHS